jgi:hypothetical protein
MADVEKVNLDEGEGWAVNPRESPSIMPLPRRSPVLLQFSSRGFSRGMNGIPPFARFPAKVNRSFTPPGGLKPRSCHLKSRYLDGKVAQMEIKDQIFFWREKKGVCGAEKGTWNGAVVRSI